MLSNHDLAKWWDDCWTSEVEMAPWGKAVSGLTPEQAAWKPTDDHHSIWEIVLHMSFWREYELSKANGEPRDEAEIARRNWVVVEDVSEAVWNGEVDRLAELHVQIKMQMDESEEKAEILRCLLMHDAYHMGQIMLLRGLQGLKAMDSLA